MDLHAAPNPQKIDRRAERGPFDIVGDVHGCFDELRELLERLGYAVSQEKRDWKLMPPAGRKLIFVGDLVDRGPRIPDVLRLVMTAVAEGKALCVAGNHDVKYLRKLHGKNVKLTHGIPDTIEQMDREPAELRDLAANFLEGLTSHYLLDGGNLVVAHAGMKEEFQGKDTSGARAFGLFGQTTGETDEFGLPVRHNWAAEYRGKAVVVYGHTPVAEPQWLNNTINIDTGCVFGGRLTALRYPEKELVSVFSRETYYESPKPFLKS